MELVDIFCDAGHLNMITNGFFPTYGLFLWSVLICWIYIAVFHFMWGVLTSIEVFSVCPKPEFGLKSLMTIFKKYFYSEYCSCISYLLKPLLHRVDYLFRVIVDCYIGKLLCFYYCLPSNSSPKLRMIMTEVNIIKQNDLLP